MEDDGSNYVTTGAGSHFGQYIDMDGGAKSESDLIRRYRDIAQQPECDAAIEDIINEAIIGDSNSSPVDIIMDDLDQPDNIKKQIKEEFYRILELLQFNHYAHDIFRKWYIDGRLFYHIIVDEKVQIKVYWNYVQLILQEFVKFEKLNLKRCNYWC